MVLSLADLQAHLDRITYKPGWAFELGHSPWEGFYVSIVTTMPDSYHPGQWTALRIVSYLPPFTEPRQFAEFLMWRLQRIETHEMQEWFKIDGKPARDPHQELNQPSTTMAGNAQPKS